MKLQQDTLKTRILRVFAADQEVTVARIVDATSIKRQLIHAVVSKLAQKGVLVRQRMGVYKLSSEAQAVDAAAASSANTPRPRKAKKMWSDEQWIALADEVFLGYLRDPMNGVNLALLQSAMKAVIPLELHRDLNGLATLPKLKEKLMPMFHAFIESWTDPKVVYRAKEPPAIDVEAVLDTVPIQLLRSKIDLREQQEAENQRARLDRLNELTAAIFEALGRLGATSPMLPVLPSSPVTVEPVAPKKQRVYVVGVKAQRWVEITEKLKNHNLEFMGAYTVDHRHDSIKGDQLPTSCDVYICNISQINHRTQHSLLANVGKERVVFCRGSHDLEETLRDIAVRGATAVLKG